MIKHLKKTVIYYYLLLFSLVMILLACEKKEIPAPKFDRGDVITNQLELLSNYKNQIWFRLSDNQIVSTNSKVDWDLAFDCDPSSNTVFINTSKVMRTSKTNSQNLSHIIDTTGYSLNIRADMPSGNKDSTAIGNWWVTNSVYIINRGYDENSTLLNFYKLKILNSTNNAFTIEYAPINSNASTQIVIQKNTAYNRVMFSFNTNQTIYLEPKKTDYDLCFTQYTHYFDNPPQYYQVTGVLNNSFNTRIAKVNSKPFNDITLSDTAGVHFSKSASAIGYDWKTFSLNTNLFTVDAMKCYIINDNKGFYYKMHFIDFYNSNGIKGYPKFEFKKL
jgi:HmuY protein